MRKLVFLPILLLVMTTGIALAQGSQPVDTQPAAPEEDLSKFIYSYGSVLKVSPSELVLQEYDYDSDVEKEVTYQLDAAIKLEGLKAVTDLVTEDVVEVYYLEQDGKKIAKIIRREAMEDDSQITKSDSEETDQ